MKFHLIFSAIALTLSCAMALGESKSSTPEIKTTVEKTQTQASTSPPVEAGQKNENKNISETDLLKQRIQITEAFIDKILSTVYYSLGGLFTLTVILIGYSWWTNNKSYENDKKRLTEDIERKISAFHESETNKFIEQLNRVEGAFNDRLNAISIKAESELTETRNRINQNFDEIKKFSQDVQKLRAKLEADISSLKKADLRTESEMRLIEAEVWEVKGIPANKLITELQGLSSSIQSGSTSTEEYYIRQINETLDKYFKDGGETIEQDTKDLLIRRLQKEDIENKEDLINILEKIKKIKISD